MASNTLQVWPPRISTFNLTALADQLSKDGRHLVLANKIRRAADLHSLCTDLLMAVESLDALDELLAVSTASDNYSKITTESALLSNAIVLYVQGYEDSLRTPARFRPSL